MSERVLRILMPLIVLVLVVLVWDLVVRGFAVPVYVLPGPGLVVTVALPLAPAQATSAEA